MAIKGVLIDINKKYKMQDGTKIVWLQKNLDPLLNQAYPIQAYFINNNGFMTPFYYTEDGFAILTKIEFEANLIPDNSSEDSQESDIIKRKAIQISAVADAHHDAVFALCNDGKIYSSWNRRQWEKYPEIPQD